MDYGIFNVRIDVNAYDCTRGCTDTGRESALKVDSGRKLPRRAGAGKSNLRQRRASPMLYQLKDVPFTFSFSFTPFSPPPSPLPFLHPLSSFSTSSSSSLVFFLLVGFWSSPSGYSRSTSAGFSPQWCFVVRSLCCALLLVLEGEERGEGVWGVGVAVAVLQDMPAPLSSSVHIRDIGRGFFLAWEDYARRFDESFPACFFCVFSVEISSRAPAPLS